ncbi:MAG: hypothetical protein C0506_01420 [Anaerolinea sp.]|nr:hypothetical protein [Anaerolinea sp.]
MTITLDWLGCATFRLTIDGLVIFLDAYMDRVPAAPPVGLKAADVDRADFVLVGHAHFDHIAGAELIAKNTGAKVIGSHESGRVMMEQGVPREQLLMSQGGERHRLGPGVTVRVFPSLHSCTWVGGNLATTEEAHGHLGLCENERAAEAARSGLGTAIGPRAGGDSKLATDLRAHLRTAVGSPVTGGPLCYLIETPQGSIFWQDTSGCWTGILRDLRPDAPSSPSRAAATWTASRSRARSASSPPSKPGSSSRKSSSPATTTTGCRPSHRMAARTCDPSAPRSPKPPRGRSSLNRATRMGRCCWGRALARSQGC